MLELSLRKSYGAFRLDIAFSAAPAQVTALFGRSGAGKTSVVRLVAGLDRPEDGRVRLGDRLLYDARTAIDLPPHRRRIGLVFQDARLLPHYSVRGNLLFGHDRTPPERRFVKLDDMVGLLGLETLLERRPATLSGGERQRVAIGRALLASPDLLIMDEPLAALDGARKGELLAYIGQLTRRFPLPILYVSHDPDEILRIAGRLVLLQDGKVVAAGGVERVMGLPQFAAAAGSRSRLTVIAASLLSHDERAKSSCLAFAGGQITVPRLALPVGSAVRARIAADHVIVARQPVAGLSVRNQLPGVVTAINEENGTVDVEIDIGCPLHAEMTYAACRDLELRPGLAVVALIKAAAIQGECCDLTL